MTLEEKLEHLRTASMEDARAIGNRILKEHSDALQTILEHHKETALRQAELTIQAEETKARQEMNKALAKAQLDLKHEQNKCHTQLKNKLFERVYDLTKCYMQTDDYVTFLVEKVQKALAFAKNESMTIYINPSDVDKIAQLEARTNTTFTVSKEDFVGGIRAVIHDRHILIDNSFASALQEEYEQFLFDGGDIHD